MTYFEFIITLLLFLLLLYTLRRSTERPKNFPPGPFFWPWIGSTWLLRSEAKRLGGQHHVFEKWATQFKADILGLKLGNELVVVVLNYPLVREVHLREEFEGRPNNFFFRLRSMGTRKGITGSDGALWYEHRNFVMKQMRNVGYGRSQMDNYIKREGSKLIDYIEGTNEKPVWPGSFLAPSVINVLWCLVAGKQFERDDEQLTKLLGLLQRRSKIFDLCGGLLTQFPWLRWVAPDKTGFSLVLQINHELHKFFMKTIEDHKIQKLSAAHHIDDDLIYAYLHEMKDRSHTEESKSFNETQLIMTILDLFIAGSQTTSNTIDLAIMTLSIRKDLQQKLFHEIEMTVNKGEEKTEKSLLYMSAFIMEVQRFYHITPITGPRRALWDTTLAGYNIPKNTTILIGLSSVLCNQNHWLDPENFRPERFLNGAELLKDEYFIPFGQGRRRCLGDALARACMCCFLTRIVQNFQIESCGASNKDNLKLQAGITLTPKPYKARFVKRVNL